METRSSWVRYNPSETSRGEAPLRAGPPPCPTQPQAACRLQQRIGREHQAQRRLRRCPRGSGDEVASLGCPPLVDIGDAERARSSRLVRQAGEPPPRRGISECARLDQPPRGSVRSVAVDDEVWDASWPHPRARSARRRPRDAGRTRPGRLSRRVPSMAGFVIAYQIASGWLDVHAVDLSGLPFSVVVMRFPPVRFESRARHLTIGVLRSAVVDQAMGTG